MHMYVGRMSSRVSDLGAMVHWSRSVTYRRTGVSHQFINIIGHVINGGTLPRSVPVNGGLLVVN